MRKLLRSTLMAVVLTILVSAIVGLIGLIARWQTPVQFSNGLFWAGILVAGVGVIGAFGDKDIRLGSGSRFFWSSPQERQARLAGAQPSDARESRSSIVSGESFNSYLLLFLSAVLIIVIGYLITIIF